MFATIALAVLLAGGSLIDLDGTFFLQLALFFVAFLLLRAFVFNPVMELFEAREKAIDGARRDARQLEREAARRTHEFEEELKRVRNASNRERDLLRAEGQRLAAELTGRTRADAQAALAKARARLEAEGAALRAESTKQVPVLAREIAARLLQHRTP